MKKICLTVLWSILLCTGFAQPVSKTSAIKTLLELTGSGQLGMQVMESMVTSYKTNFPKVPTEFWEQFIGEVNADTLVSLVIPVYEKHFTYTEILELTSFYQTVLGKKVIATMPVIMQESMQIGEAWGESLAEKIYNRLVQNGYAKKD